MRFVSSANIHQKGFNVSLTDWFGTLFSRKLKVTAVAPPPAVPPKLPGAADEIREAILRGECPQGLTFKNISLAGVKTPFILPSGLRCFGLDLSNSAVSAIPADISVEFKLNLSGCTVLKELPSGLRTGSLVLNGCTSLSALPEGLAVSFLNLDGCANLAHWPESAVVEIGSLRARGCTALPGLPQSLKNLTNLDLAGCRKISSLPDGLRLSGWLDLADTAIVSLPPSLQNVRLRWRGVEINPQIAFFPETLSTAIILDEPNAEVRRVMLERRGLETFFKDATATILDQDTDAGGPRKLLKIPLPGDEDLVCVSLNCPSTGRHYLVRVPPGIKTCHAAVAWTAGFDNPNDYRPLVET